MTWNLTGSLTFPKPVESRLWTPLSGLSRIIQVWNWSCTVPCTHMLQRCIYNFFFATLTFSALGEVTMVCLAPLTNLALALKTAPSVAADLKEVVLMGGNIEGVGNTSIAAEFNFHADPEAAFVVLDAARCPVVVVSWELCFKYIHIPMVSSTSAMFHPQLTTIADPTQLHLQEWRLEVLGKTGTKQAEMFNRLEQPWFDNYEFDPEIWILCDQLAVAVALDRTIVTASRHKKVARLLRVSPPWS